MRKALITIVLLVCISAVSAAVDYPLADSYSKNALREQQRDRFIDPENWEQKTVIENGAFVRGQPRNVVVKNRVSHVKPAHERAEIYSGSTNIPQPARRRGIFDYALEQQRRGFFQENSYISDYARHVKTTPYREYRYVPADASMMRLIRPTKQEGSPTVTGQVTVTVVPPATSS